MTRPLHLGSRIFLDSGDPAETREALSVLGFLDGQTTNPSLMAKNPELRQRLDAGEKLSSDDVNTFYKGVVREISDMLPEGSVSIEVYADKDTSEQEILFQAHAMNSWIANAHIKLPITASGLSAAQVLVHEGIRVNMTLCFSQQQAAAVYTATMGAQKGDVFLSPFIGRFDDRGENGMSFIRNVLQMFSHSDHHVEVLAASVRTYEHLQCCLAYGADIITSPLSVLKEWASHDLEIPADDYVYDKKELKDFGYQDVILDQSWNAFNIQHDLTDAGLEKFAKDWNSLISK